MNWYCLLCDIRQSPTSKSHPAVTVNGWRMTKEVLKQRNCPVNKSVNHNYPYMCWNSLFVERWTCDRKVASSNLGRSSGRIFFSRVNFVCWLVFSLRSTPVLLQWHVKDPDHSAKSAGGRLHLNTHTILTKQSQTEACADYAAVHA